MFKNSYRIDRMEKCCEKLTGLVEQSSKNEIRSVDNYSMLERDIHSINTTLKEYFDKEGEKTKWIYGQLEELKRADNRIIKYFYLFAGGGTVLLFLSKYVKFGIVIN